MARNMPRPSGSSGSEATQSEGDEPIRSGEGLREIARTISDTRFPAERRELEEQIGEETVEVTKGQHVTMRDVLAKLPEERFESDVEFRRAVEQNWEGITSLRPVTKEPRSEATREEEREPRPAKKARKRPVTKARGLPRPKVNRGRTTNRNAGTRGSNRSAVKRGGDRGGNERAAGKSGNQRPGGRGRQQRGSKTERAATQRKQALGARNRKTRGRRTGAVPGRRATRKATRKR